MSQRDLLIEIGCEEIPAKDQPVLGQALAERLAAALDAQGIAHGELRWFAAPRRLALWAEALATQQDTVEVYRRGPALSAAFDAQGKPSPAVLGFAKSCGVDIDALQREDSDKGVFLVHRASNPGRATQVILPELISAVVHALPLRKRMRWAAGEAEFVRPVKWLLALFGDTPLSLSLFEHTAGSHSFGHRIHHPQAIFIQNPADYPQALMRAQVMADFQQRRQRIYQEAFALAQREGGSAWLPDSLLDEITGLNEWPLALAGQFDAAYLDIPPEVLSTVMIQHQRYVPVLKQAGAKALLNRFIFIANLESQDPAAVIHGNERVLRARFSDASFFWQADRKTALDTHLAGLATVTFQKGLGSLADKTQRLQALAPALAAFTDATASDCAAAARLCKCDLLSGMVGEFPELQGVMGGYYARHDGHSDVVALAISEHYQPAGRDDPIAPSAAGRALALADKLDNLVGFFGIGQIPSGDKDPFGLRRAALGVLRTALEGQLRLDLPAAIQAALSAYGERFVDQHTQIAEAVFSFCLERLRVIYRDQGFAADLVEAVLSLRPADPLDAQARLLALSQFRQRPEAEALAAANKRISNILRKEGVSQTGAVQAALLTLDAEKALWQIWMGFEKQLGAALKQADYVKALDLLATLREPADRFFDEVMVMVEDAAIRDNRLALLSQLRAAFLRIADISLLQN